MVIKGGSGAYDPEGIAAAPDQTLWIASGGNPSDSRPNRLSQIDHEGNARREVGLPQAILDCRKSTKGKPYTNTLGSGFEGVAVLHSPEGGYRLLVAQQRGWNFTTEACEALPGRRPAGVLN